MPQGMPDDNDAKTSQRTHWNAVAPGWAAWIEWTERYFDPVTEWFRGTGVWPPGGTVLDVACGAGYPALAAAAAVGSEGRVVATDISSEMAAATARRARVLGLHNIDCLEMDAEHLRCEPAVFDSVTNAYGLMFCPDLRRALAETRRVLKPGGRIAIVTWDAPARSPFFMTMLPLAARFLQLQPPAPDTPGPFRLSDGVALETLLRAAGFEDVRVESRPLVLECASAEEYFQIFSDIAWKRRIASLPASEITQFKAEVAEASQPYLEDDRLRFVATSLCATAWK